MITFSVTVSPSPAAVPANRLLFGERIDRPASRKAFDLDCRSPTVFPLGILEDLDRRVRDTLPPPAPDRVEAMDGLPPASVISAVTESTVAGVRDATTTLAPSRAYARATRPLDSCRPYPQPMYAPIRSLSISGARAALLDRGQSGTLPVTSCHHRRRNPVSFASALVTDWRHVIRCRSTTMSRRKRPRACGRRPVREGVDGHDDPHRASVPESSSRVHTVPRRS